MNLRLTIASAVAFVVLLCPPLCAQLSPPTTPFSGDLQIASSTGEPMHGKLYFSPKHLRMDMQGGPHGDVVILTNVSAGTSDMIMPAQHVYMEFKTDQHRPGLAPNIKGFRDPSNPCADEQGTKCRKVGMEQINGRSCDRWLITQKDGSVSTVWIDQKLHFPIKTETKGDTWQLTNIKEGEPNASLFVIPAGYRKLNVNGMPRPAQ